MASDAGEAVEAKDVPQAEAPEPVAVAAPTVEDRVASLEAELAEAKVTLAAVETAVSDVRALFAGLGGASSIVEEFNTLKAKLRHWL